MTKNRVGRPKGHGLIHLPEYRAWIAMRQRCRSKYNLYYGGRGIIVCDRWVVFENFYADMGPRPTPSHSLDRINNDGNYKPSNCRWATKKEQSVNRSITKYIEFNGKKIHVSEAARIYNVPRDTLAWRLARWPVARALLTPVRKMTTVGLILFICFSLSVRAEDAIKIGLGDTTPYGGVLMSTPQFMAMDSELAACRYVQDHPAPCEEETDYKSLATIGMFSFSLGAIVGLFVLRK